MNMCLIGGGPKKEILREAQGFSDGGRVLVVPSACSTKASYAKKVPRTLETFKELGMSPVVLHNFGEKLVPEAVPYMFSSTDMLYVIGGHTPTLKRNMDSMGLLPEIKSFMDRGGLYTGTSAGALAVMNEAMVCPARRPAEENWDYELLEMGGLVKAVATAHANGIDGNRTSPRIHYFRDMMQTATSETGVAIDEGVALLIIEDGLRTLRNNPAERSSTVTVFNGGEPIALDPAWTPASQVNLQIS